MFFFCYLLFEQLKWGLDGLRVKEEERCLWTQIISKDLAIQIFVLRDQSAFLIYIVYWTWICPVKLSNILELIFCYLLFWFELLIHFVLDFIPFCPEYNFSFLRSDLSMISFYIAIYSILQGFITNELRFFLIEISQEFLHKLLPVE